MPDTAIQVKDLGKKYLIQHKTGERYTALRDVIAKKSVSLGRRICRPFNRTLRNSGSEELWALRDINFEVARGEVVGIIGRNGAGKSTLLKILSRITEPTTGSIRIRGRVASLLEVGTGFHPELTGRENIFLNGAILGMSKAEIKSKFDEIVAFSETEKFLDTPVKRYSSGMRVRLAFSVAAHLDTEILFIDEVLAVGDVEFQKKCMGKMGTVAKQGRTILFVSHNMTAVQHLCGQGIMLSKGEIQFSGNIDQTVIEYLKGFRISGSGATINLAKHEGRRPNRPVLFQKAQLIVNGDIGDVAKVGDSLEIKLWIDSGKDLKGNNVWVVVENDLTQRIFSVSTKYVNRQLLDSAGRKTIVSCYIPKLPLLPGDYYLSVFIGDDKHPGDAIDYAMRFSVQPYDYFGSGYIPERGKGSIFTESKWSAAAI